MKAFTLASMQGTNSVRIPGANLQINPAQQKHLVAALEVLRAQQNMTPEELRAAAVETSVRLFGTW